MTDGKAVFAGRLVELVEIDGKRYLDKGGDVAEFFPARAEGVFNGQKVEFVEGGTYENSYGTCLVWHIREDGKMVVEYVASKNGNVAVGERAEYPVKAQVEAVVKEAIRAKEEAEGKSPFKGISVLTNDEVAEASWVARNGTFRVQLPEKCLERFLEWYEGVAGESPIEDYVRVRDGYWAVGLRVDFSVPKGEVLRNVKLPDGVHISCDGDSTSSISNNAYVGGLILAGLKLGKNADKAEALAA